MTNPSLEELRSSFRYRDDEIFDIMTERIKQAKDFILVNISQVEDGYHLCVDPKILDGSSYLFFGDELETDTVELIPAEVMKCLVPITTAERIFNIEFIEEDVVTPCNKVLLHMDRFYNYIRSLR